VSLSEILSESRRNTMGLLAEQFVNLVVLSDEALVKRFTKIPGVVGWVPFGTIVADQETPFIRATFPLPGRASYAQYRDLLIDHLKKLDEQVVHVVKTAGPCLAVFRSNAIHGTPTNFYAMDLELRVYLLPIKSYLEKGKLWGIRWTG